MRKVMVNGHALDPGCYVDGSNRSDAEGDAAVVKLARSLGWQGYGLFFESPSERAELWLNQLTQEGYMWTWHASDFLLLSCADAEALS